MHEGIYPMPTVMITGANRGLGVEFVRQYLEGDWYVIATCRKPEQATELQALKEINNGQVEIYPLEITNNAAIDKLARQLDGVAIDIFIQNAGIDLDDEFRKTSFEHRLQIFRINTLPVLQIAEAFIDHIAASDQKKLIYISSLKASTTESAGHTGGGQYCYRASKAAGNSIIKALSFDLAEQGVTTAAISPGWVRTEMGGPHAPLSPEQSVTLVRQVIDNLSLANSGGYFNQNGAPNPW